jgi:hypothetical protein
MYPQLSRGAGFILGLQLLGLFSVACAQTPAQTPAQASRALFSRVGVIGNLDLPTGSITVNDFRYQLSPHVRVYVFDQTVKDPQALRADTRLQDGHALRAGVHIGYIVEGEAGGKRGTLTEAWILPTGSLPELAKGVKSTESPVTKGTGKAQPGR